MKFISSFLLAALFSLSLLAQNCGTDSIVTYLQRDRGDDYTNTFVTDTFDIVNGVRIPSMAPFDRRYLALTNNHDTASYVLTTGTGSGYVNKRRIDFTYDAVSNRILSRTEYSGAGNAWNVLRTELWNYNVNFDLTDYTLTDTSGNVTRAFYTYAGNVRQSILYQAGLGATWTNDRLFNIVYNGNSRDSLVLKKWDVLSSSWVDSLSAKYILLFNYTATLSDTIFGSHFYVNTFSFDTLDLMVYEYHLDSIVGGLYQDWQGSYSSIHGHQLVTNRHYHVMGCTSGDELTVYDPYGVVIGESHDGHCGIGSGGNNHTVYDSLYRVINYQSYGYSSVSSIWHYWDYYYFSPDSINLNYIPLGTISYVGDLCTGDSITTTLVGGGGCGPFTYSWSPATGLSSDTVAQPMVCLQNDTITYTITVTDTTGHANQTTFQAFPAFTTGITFDTTACQGCPVVLHGRYYPSTFYEWFRNDTLIQGVNGSDCTASNSGAYYYILHSQSCTSQSDSVVLTLSGLTRLTGRIYWDRDSDCTYTSADTAMSSFGFRPFLIGVTRPNYAIVISVDSNGIFDIPVDTGSFTLHLYNATNLLTPVCTGTDSILVNIPAFGDTISGNDFPLKGDTSCKRLEVRVSSLQFRPCQPTVISVWYSNETLASVGNSTVDVSIPSELNVTSASVPFTVTGNNYSFNFPSLAPGERGVISISADVVCNSNLANATLCIEAEISPKDFCSLQPDSSWDGSNVRIHSYCNNDSLACFTLSNESVQGNGNMNTSAAWRLYNDNILIQQGTYLLNANADTTLCFVTDGSTYRLEADQTSGFPVSGYVSSSIERCGPDTNNFTLDQILHHMSPENLPFYYTYCKQITNSFDPNIKSVQPVGLGPNHYIPSGQILKYRIDFQNTGTDTASYVEIRDQLNSAIFNLTSIEFVGASHPYQYEFTNSTLKFKFYNINLPDSGANQLASHGYVEFLIKTKLGKPNGFLFSNTADIYFDSNQPITTLGVIHRICDVVNPSVVISSDSAFCLGKILKCRATILNGGSPVINWYRNSSLLVSHADSLTFAGLRLNDTIYCTVQSNVACAYPVNVQSNMLVFDQYSIPIPVVSYSTPNLVSTTAYSYQWLNNMVVIPSATLQNYIPPADGTYEVQVWDSNGCTAISTPFVYINSGIASNIYEHLSVYPNPANDFINIEYNAPINSVRLTDAIGKTLYFQKSTSAAIRISVKDLKPGKYLLEILSGERKMYKPLILVRE